MMISSKFLRVLLVLGSIVVSLLVGEGLLRVLDKPKPPVSGWRAVAVSSKEQNQFGFRGQRIEYTDDDFVIVLVGDSFVEAKACAYDWMPERRLQFYLNETGRRVKVFSVAASGYGQDQELLGLREYLESFRADMVILWEVPINDIWNNVFPSSMPAAGTPKPTFWLENGQLHGPSEQMGWPIRENSRLKLVQLWRKNIRWSRDRLWERYYPPAYKPLAEFNGEVKDDWQQLWHDSADFRREDIENEKSHMAISLTPRSERTQYGLDLTRKLMQEMERLAASGGGQFITFTTNTSSSSLRNDGVNILNGKYYRTSANQLKENIDYINQGFKFFVVPVTVEQWQVGPENSHLNEHATDQVMKDLAKQIGMIDAFQNTPIQRQSGQASKP